MPTFIVAGERRSGTSSVAKWLGAHPQIYIKPTVDEAYFVDTAIVGRRQWLDGKVKTEDWHTTHSNEAYARQFLPSDCHLAWGEKSADYLHWHSAHERMASFAPDAKIVLTLRNPIERAWSMYWNEFGKGREKLSFEEAIKQESDRISQSDYARMHLSYVTRGHYAQNIIHLLKFFPREQILILILEELRLDLAKAMRPVYQFLGVDSDFEVKFGQQQYNHNWTTVPKQFWTRHPVLKNVEQGINKFIKTTARVLVRDTYRRRRIIPQLESPFRNTKEDFIMATSTLSQLVAYYRPHIEELEELMGRKLECW